MEERETKREFPFLKWTTVACNRSDRIPASDQLYVVASWLVGQVSLPCGVPIYTCAYTYIRSLLVPAYTNYIRGLIAWWMGTEPLIENLFFLQKPQMIYEFICTSHAQQFRQFHVDIFENRTPRGTVDFVYSIKCVSRSTHTRHNLFITNWIYKRIIFLRKLNIDFIFSLFFFFTLYFIHVFFCSSPCISFFIHLFAIFSSYTYFLFEGQERELH